MRHENSLTQSGEATMLLVVRVFPFWNLSDFVGAIFARGASISKTHPSWRPLFCWMAW